TLGIIPTLAGGILTAYLLLASNTLPYDYTVFGYLLTGGIFAETLFKKRFLDITPVARRIAVVEMQDAMITIDDENRVVDSNRSARELFGVGDDWAGMPTADFFGLEATDSSTEFWNELNTDTEFGATIDGVNRYFSVSITPVGDRSGGSRVILLHEITERKEKQAQLQRQRDRLDEFASVVSHDLRNPLSVIDGRLLLAQDECDSEHLDDIGTAVSRMETLIDDLLTLAREGEQVSETERIDLEPFAEHCWQYVDASKASLRTDVEQSIWADRSRLQQLLENLMRNATEHGGDDVRITVGGLEDGFYVEDDGPGIPPEDRDEVLETGYSTSEEGTGFGLSIVEQIVDAHGWTVRVTEGTDGGARFEITGVNIGR
ncbi:MAG: ATP-binding protein, partial [Natronomonas sp.]